MKSAEEWIKEPWIKHIDLADIREIQLDAWKQGMEDAALIVANQSLTSLSNVLFAHRDNKTTL